MDSKVLIGKIKELNKKLNRLCTGAALRQLKSGIVYDVGKVTHSSLSPTQSLIGIWG